MTIKRIFACSFWLFVLLTFTGCDFFCNKFGTCEEPEEETFGKVGCYAASYTTGSSYGTSIGTTLNDPHYDQKMNEEVTIQRLFFSGVPATVWILNEGSSANKNAYASPDGHILFGYHMFWYIVNSYNELAIAGVLAHEWGHRTQYIHSWSTQNPAMELEADAFSGYYMGLAKQWAWDQIQGYYQNTYASGEYNFHSPNHHGTPSQRLAAAYLGVNMALSAIQNNKPYSYQELHQIFSQQITARVFVSELSGFGEEGNTPDYLQKARNQLNTLEIESIATGKSQGSEITYPRILSREDLLRLRPYSEQ